MSRKMPEIAIYTHPISLVQDPDRIRGAHRGDLIHQGLYFLECVQEEEDVRQAMHRAFALAGVDADRWNMDEEFVAPLVRALSLPEVRPWFEPGVVSLREADMVDARGELHRIDRLIIGDERIEILDFKVGYREEEYIKQVLLYKDLVSSVFNKPVKAYILYIDESTVIEVP